MNTNPHKQNADKAPKYQVSFPQNLKIGNAANPHEQFQWEVAATHPRILKKGPLRG